MSGDRELDCRIAEILFGWKEGRTYGGVVRHGGLQVDGIRLRGLEAVPPYSTDIAEAMKVIDAWEWDIEIDRNGGEWTVVLERQLPRQLGVLPRYVIRRAHDVSLPMAICRVRLAEEFGE